VLLWRNHVHPWNPPKSCPCLVGMNVEVLEIAGVSLETLHKPARAADRMSCDSGAGGNVNISVGDMTRSEHISIQGSTLFTVIKSSLYTRYYFGSIS